MPYFCGLWAAWYQIWPPRGLKAPFAAKFGIDLGVLSWRKLKRAEIKKYCSVLFNFRLFNFCHLFNFHRLCSADGKLSCWQRSCSSGQAAGATDKTFQFGWAFFNLHYLLREETHPCLFNLNLFNFHLFNFRPF